MAARKALDRRPGPLPEIYTDGDSVTFAFDFDEPAARFIVRCDSRGEVFACILEPPPAGPSYPFTPGE